jgi:DNA replication protein DnaC
MMRIRTAHFPQVKTLEDFNLDHLPSLRRDVCRRTPERPHPRTDERGQFLMR